MNVFTKEARGKVYAILQDTTRDYADRLAAVYRTYAIDAGEDGVWLQILDSLEYLDVDHKNIFMKYSSEGRPEGKDEYLERFLAYLTYRHCTDAIDAEDFFTRLSFCLFCERLFASLICTEEAETLREVAGIATMISEEIEYSDDNTFALMG